METNKTTRELAEIWQRKLTLPEWNKIRKSYGITHTQPLPDETIIEMYLSEHPAEQAQGNPDFINDENSPETGFELISINKASFNGDTYSWSSNAKGWYKDTPPTKELSTVGYTQGEWDFGYGDSSGALGIYTKKMLDEGTMEHPICLISPIDKMNDTDKANAQRIVTAVNNHDALVSALQKMVEWHEKVATWDKGDNGYYAAKQLLNNIK